MSNDWTLFLTCSSALSAYFFHYTEEFNREEAESLPKNARGKWMCLHSFCKYSPLLWEKKAILTKSEDCVHWISFLYTVPSFFLCLPCHIYSHFFTFSHQAFYLFQIFPILLNSLLSSSPFTKYTIFHFYTVYAFFFLHCDTNSLLLNWVIGNWIATYFLLV